LFHCRNRLRSPAFLARFFDDFAPNSIAVQVWIFQRWKVAHLLIPLRNASGLTFLVDQAAQIGGWHPIIPGKTAKVPAFFLRKLVEEGQKKPPSLTFWQKLLASIPGITFERIGIAKPANALFNGIPHGFEKAIGTSDQVAVPQKPSRNDRYALNLNRK
jgi:hypothetical protein